MLTSFFMHPTDAMLTDPGGFKQKSLVLRGFLKWEQQGSNL